MQDDSPELQLPFSHYRGGGRQLLGKPSSGDATCRHGYGPNVFKECGTACVYCDRELSEPYESWLDISVDHVVPQSTVEQLGYPHEWVEDLINKVTCCEACNHFLSRHAVNDPVPATLDEFVKIRNRVFTEKRKRALDCHRRERVAHRAWLDKAPTDTSYRTGVSVAGVDGCHDGWVVVHLSGEGTVTARVVERFEEILQFDAAVIAVDIPVGLIDTDGREADTEARRFVGARRSSVFPTPIRTILSLDSYDEANRISRKLIGKGVSRQAFALRGRILEVSAFAETDPRIIEIHPEVSFCELAGKPLTYPKHESTGLIERRALLRKAKLPIPETPPGAKDDDLLDALAAAWSGIRYAKGIAQPFPAGHSDRIGAIWR